MPEHPLEYRDALVSRATATSNAIVGAPVTIGSILDGIKNGQYADRIAQLRATVQPEAAKALKHNLPAVIFGGTFSTRSKAGLITRSGVLVVDFDHLPAPTVTRAALANDPHVCAAFISPSGTGLKALVAVPTDIEHLRCFKAAEAHFKSAHGLTADPSGKDVNRLCYVSHDVDTYLADPASVQLIPVPEPAPVAPVPATVPVETSTATPEIIALARAHVAAMPAAISGQNGHQKTWDVALALAWGFALCDAEAMPLFQEYNARCSPPWDTSDLEHKLDGARSPADGKPPHGWLLPPVFDASMAMESQDLNTDLDASLRFAEWQQKDLRYCPGLGWLAWDGKRWAVDGEGRALELGKQSARLWTSKRSGMTGDGREARIKAALGLESGSRVRSAVDLAKSDPRLAISAGELDRDPWKLNVLNGTLDLRTGELHPHRREDYISKFAPVTFTPGATHPVLEKFLSTVEASTPGMRSFLARCFGAALTGDASTESLFILQGDGGSGKTTLTEAVAVLLGDYAVKMGFESFVLARHGRGPGSASPDLIKLRGSRLAYASEGDQSARLDAGAIKMLTGNESVTARALYGAPITFAQTWKLWLVSNYDPRADSDDSGLWRRMLKLKFAAIPKEHRDPNIKRTLTGDPAARSALLAWALAGCLDWQTRGGGRIGLAPPEAVEAATAEYRLKSDTLNEWWEDMLATDGELRADGVTTSESLRRHYENWADSNGAARVFSARFATFLQSKGLSSHRGTGGVRVWRGVNLHFNPTGTSMFSNQ